jgi:hypothetical protein
MTTRQTLADQRAHLYDGLRDLSCDSCGALVRVKKNSQLHTSVQWSVRGVRDCAEFAARQRTVEPLVPIATCGRLRDTIERAVREGRLHVATAPGP